MDTMVQPEFDRIKKALQELDGANGVEADPDLKKDIKKLFDDNVPSLLENSEQTASDLLFNSQDFNELNMQFSMKLASFQSNI